MRVVDDHRCKGCKTGPSVTLQKSRRACRSDLQTTKCIYGSEGTMKHFTCKGTTPHIVCWLKEALRNFRQFTNKRPSAVVDLKGVGLYYICSYLGYWSRNR